MVNIKRHPTDNFFKHVSPEPNCGCWLWTGFVDKDGYGNFSILGIGSFRAHRYSWEIHNGSIPDGMHVCHKCDVPGCVNPEHLFLGTNQENMTDSKCKGRRANGAKNGNSKLTADLVRAIRAEDRPHKEIAAAYGISLANVSFIRTRYTWRHV